MIEWNKVTKEAVEGAAAVIARAHRVNFTPAHNDWMGLHMDLEAASLVVDIDWVKFYESSYADFSHDLGGIYRNLDRETGELRNGFVPRCTKRDDDREQESGEAAEAAPGRKRS